MKKTANIEAPVQQDIIFQVLKELPAKSLLRFRSVSKLWRFIIDDSNFVDVHRTRSNTRFGGIRLLVCTEDGDRSDFFLTDPEGGPTFHLLTLPPYCCCDNPLPSVNGLVYMNNRILNPCTRESMDLPPISFTCDVRAYAKWEFIPEYFLGYDSSTKAYKVLNISRIYIKKKDPLDISKNVVCEHKIFTIGTNSWRNIYSVPLELQNFFKSDRSCWIDDVIYCLAIIDPVDNEDVIVAFEVGLENFRIMPLPRGTETVCYMIQVGGRLALIDQEVDTIWMLEDYNTQRWIRETLVIPPRWRKNQGYNTGGTTLIPVGSIHTSEILFKSSNFSPRFFFYYDMASKKSWSVPELNMFPAEASLFFTKHVESLSRLKLNT